MFSELFALGYFIPTIAITTFSRKEDFYQKPPVYSENTILSTSQHLPLDNQSRGGGYHEPQSICKIMLYNTKPKGCLIYFELSITNSNINIGIN